MSEFQVNCKILKDFTMLTISRPRQKHFGISMKNKKVMETESFGLPGNYRDYTHFFLEEKSYKKLRLVFSKSWGCDRDQ